MGASKAKKSTTAAAKQRRRTERKAKAHRSASQGTVRAAPAATGQGRTLGSAVEIALDGRPVDSLNAAERATIGKIGEVDALLRGRGWALDPDSDVELVTWRFPTADLPAGDTRGTGISLPPYVDIEHDRGLMVLHAADPGALRCEVEFPVPCDEGETEGEYGGYSDYYSGFERPLEVVLAALEVIEALRFGEDPGALPMPIR